MYTLHTSREIVGQHIQKLLIESHNTPWNIAEDIETLGLGEITSSSYQRKNSEFLTVELWDKSSLFSGPLPCNGNGVCQTCNGAGEHLRFSYDFKECQTCNGSGDCPCQFDMTAHPAPHA